MKNKKYRTEILHHLGEGDLPFGAVNPPIFQTSIFSFKSFAHFKESLNDEVNNYLYTRGNNPTVELVEKKLAELENGEKAKLVSSGVAAISGSILAFLESGDHVLSVRDTYSWTKTLLERYLKRFKVSHSYVEGIDLANIEANIKENTKIIYLESPTTFSFKIQDLKKIAERNKRSLQVELKSILEVHAKADIDETVDRVKEILEEYRAEGRYFSDSVDDIREIRNR